MRSWWAEVGEYIYASRPPCQRAEYLKVLIRDVNQPGFKLVDYAVIPVKEPSVPEACSECNNMSTNIYVRALDAAGNYISGEGVVFSTPDESVVALLRPRGELDYCFDPQGLTYYGQAFKMEEASNFNPAFTRGPLRVSMAGNSDELNGMGLPLKRHVQFVLTFQRVETGGDDGDGDTDPPDAQYGPWYVKRQTARRIVTVRDLLPQ